MKKAATIILFILQCYCVVNGRELLGRDGNPFTLFFASLLIAVLFLYNKQKGPENVDVRQKTGSKLAGFVIGCIPVILMIAHVRRMFWEIPDPASMSDVIPQLDALYTRFARGEQPYYPLEQFSWHPFPVYMPLNWLPLAIPHWLHIDVRWAGIIALIVANGLWGVYVWQKNSTYLLKILAICLPAVPMFCYLQWARFDISVSIETLIAGYYLILIAGLLSRNIWLITAGIILCLLSRYTLVFWLPLFALLLWQNKQVKTNLAVWGSVIAAVLLLYIIPFYLKDPTILTSGVTYHNNCAIAEWDAAPRNEAWTFFPGLYFAPYMLQLTSGSMEHRVFIARVVQALLMLGLVAWGYFYYWKNRTRISYYDVGAATLYLVVLVFYAFSPLLYRYYYITMLCMSAALCGNILLKRRNA